MYSAGQKTCSKVALIKHRLTQPFDHLFWAIRVFTQPNNQSYLDLAAPPLRAREVLCRDGGPEGRRLRRVGLADGAAVGEQGTQNHKMFYP